MGLNAKTVRITRPVWSDGRDPNSGGDPAGDLFLPFFQIEVAKAATARVSFLLEANSGSLAVKRAIRYSNDRVTWAGTAEIGTAGYSSSTSWQYGGASGTDFNTSDVSYRFVEFGMFAQNTTGVTNMEMGLVSMILDLRGP